MEYKDNYTSAISFLCLFVFLVQDDSTETGHPSLGVSGYRQPCTDFLKLKRKNLFTEL